MKILHVTPTYLPATRYGGPIFSVHGLAKAQAALGHDVHIMTTNVDGEQDSPVNLGADVEMDGVHVWYFPSNFLRRLYYAPQMKSWLKKRILNFDVLHLHSVYLWPTNMAARIAVRNKVPYVLAPRGMLVRELIEGRSAWIKKIWLKLIERKTTSKAHFMHYTTVTERDQAQLVGLALAEGRIVANGIDLPNIKNCEQQDRRCDYILYLGRISWKKGIDSLIESLVFVPELKLKIVGNDEEGYSQQLRKLVAKKQLEERVEFLPAQYGEAKKQLYQSACLFVLASQSENFANVVLEAMSYGCPVIVSKGVGLHQAVSEARAGLVSDRTPEQLAVNIRRIYDNPQERLEMSINGMNLVERNYSWSIVAKQMIDVYQETQ